MTRLSSGWLYLQLAVFLAYMFVTVFCFRTKKSNRFSSVYGFYILLGSAFAIPFVALAEHSFWTFLLLSGSLWFLLIVYDLLLIGIVSPNNEGAIVFMIPVMAWALSWPLAILAHGLFRWVS